VVYYAPVEADDHVIGPADAKVTIVEAFEYACPHCRTAGQVLAEVAKKYPKDVRIVGKQFLIHPQIATLPAYAACAANKQGRYHELSEELWKRAWPVAEGAPGPRLDREALTQASLEKLAADVKLDLARFKADMAGDACKKEVAADQAQMQAIGVTGTPSIFVNGRIYMGPRSVEGFSAVIDEEIKKANATGGNPAEYYTNLMKSAKKSI
jgi:protein-disulfide isomerase